MSTKVDCKIVLLGMSGTGKTCLVERYLYDRFEEFHTTTVGAAFGAKRISTEGRSVTLGIWDTAGSERYESMTKIYYRSAWGAILCYDVTSQESMDKVFFWVNELKENEPNCRVYLVGTKADRVAERRVDDAYVNNIAAKIQAKTAMTSAKLDDGVSELFTMIARDYAKTLHPALEPYDPFPRGNVELSGVW